MDFVYYIVGFGLLMLLVVRVMHWKNLLSMTLHTPKATSSTRKDIPDNIKHQLINGEFELKKLGFQYSHCYRATEIFARLKDERWCVVLVHPEKCCFAEISNTLNPDVDFPFKLNLYSFFDDDSSILTINNEAHSIISHMDGFIFNDPYSTNINGIVESHFNRANKHVSDSSNDIEPLSLNEAVYIGTLNTLYKEYFIHLEDCNLVSKIGEEYRLRLSTVIKLTERMLKGAKKVAKKPIETALQNNSASENLGTDVSLIEAEIAAFKRNEQLTNDSKLSGLGKGFFFLVSVLMFAAVFGVTWSPSLLIVIVGVLLFHELGHIVGMWLFGYRDLQILFIPFMGALASGKKDNPTALQKAIVSLLGPLPGLILAFALARLYPEMQIEWLNQTILMLFIINYLNLLPLMPLDGGQLLNTVVFDRYPKLQFGFLFVSAGLLAYGAWAFADPILTILAVIMGYSLLAQFNQAKLLSGILKEHKDSDGEDKALHRILTVLSKAPYDKWKFIQKYQLAKQLLVRFQHRLPKLRESVFALVLYFITLGAPIAFIAPVLLQSQLFTDANEYWDESIEDAVSPEEKIMALMNAAHYHGMIEDLEKTGVYYKQAVALSEEDKNLSDWRPLASLGLSLTINEPSIQASLKSFRDAKFSNVTLVQEIEKLASYSERRNSSDEIVIQLYKLAKESYTKLGEVEQEAYLTITMSNIYKKIQDFESAEQILIEGAELVKEQDYTTKYAIHNTLAEFYFSQQAYGSAENVWLQMLNELTEDELLDYASSQIYINLGWNALASNDFDKAQELFTKSYEFSKANIKSSNFDDGYSDGSYSLVENRLDLVALSIAKNDRNAAKEYLNQAKGLWKNAGMDWNEFIEIQSSDTDYEEFGTNGVHYFRAIEVRHALLVLKE